MTLCIAAPCYVRDQDNNIFKIVCGWDSREENQFAGGDIAYKLAIPNPSLLALQSGEGSAPEDFLATCMSCLPDRIDHGSAFDVINAAVGLHKRKLCERRAQRKFGIDYERILTKDQEIPTEVRERFFYELEKLDPGFEVILLGFSETGFPLIFVVDGFDVRSCSQTFATIGSGAIIA